MNALGRIALAAWVATMMGALTLTPVFAGPFLFLTALVCAVVTGTGILLHNLRLPPVAIIVIQFVVLAELLALLFARETVKFGLVPWSDTAIELRGQFARALDTMGDYHAPLPASPELTCLATAVIAVIGLLVHVIATQFRQAAWAGLLLLAMYTVPAATLDDGLPMLLFVPPAVGYIVLLSSEAKSRLTRWGRRIAAPNGSPGEPAEASVLGQTGRRIGVTVVAVAAILPTLIPSLPGGVMQNGLGPGSGGGSGNSIGRDPMLNMGKNLRRGPNDIAFRYNGERTYFRMTTLDIFDGTRWQSSSRNADLKVEGPLVPPPGYQKDLRALPQQQYEVSTDENLELPWVPVPYPVRELSIEGDWRYHPGTLDVLAAEDQTVAGMQYALTAYDIRPKTEELRSAENTVTPDQHTLDVPERVHGTIGALAKQITAGAGDNPYQQAVLLERHLRDENLFEYSTAEDRDYGLDTIEAFLTRNRTGYCVQFAASMALMARSLGLPARLAIGFLPGKPQPGGTNLVRMHDLHAWPELYFEGIGWVRFEPTPGNGAVPPAYTQPSAAPKPGPSTTPTPTARPERPDRPQERPERPDQQLPPPGNDNWWDGAAVRWSAGAVGVVALLCIPWIVRSLVRRRRFAQPDVESLWAEVRDTARDLRVPWSASATPRQICGELCDHLPKRARSQAIKLTRAIETARYSDRADPGADLRSPASAVHRALWRGASRGRRWRARLLPPSWRWYLLQRAE